MLDRVEAISKFLATQVDLGKAINLYQPGFEVQVNVSSEGGQRVEGKLAYSNDTDTWAPYRIPYNGAGVDAEPTYSPTLQQWPLEKYAEAIGLTGWNWQERKSYWVGFDFDSLIGHANGLTDKELEEIKDSINRIPWITLRRSTGGNGYHLYVFLAEPVSTRNHTEHAALARSILSMLSGILNFSFEGKVDKVGELLWVWHKKASPEKHSFELLKQGSPLLEIPLNWKEHIDAVKLKKRKKENNPELNHLVSNTSTVKLDDGHKALLVYLANQPNRWWWDDENKTLITHTKTLADAFRGLGFIGLYSTISTGRDLPNDHNCFCFPTRSGSWLVRRFGKKTKEDDSWTTDQTGWTKCYLNRLPDLETICRIGKAKRTKNGNWIFKSLRDAVSAFSRCGTKISAPEGFLHRQATVSTSRNEGEIIISIPREQSDGTDGEDWVSVRGPKWEQTISVDLEVPTYDPPDGLLRYTIRGGIGYTWFINNGGTWISESKDNARSLLLAQGIPRLHIENILGQSIQTAWEIVNQPFEGEYPGDRKWNLKAPQLAFTPSAGNYDVWINLLKHIGESLNEEVLNNSWCTYNNIVDGSHYLCLWIACLLRFPFQPLPYLFLWGNQNSGKSISHEAISLLLKQGIGYVRADHSLTNQTGFNGELEAAILCVVEEVDLNKNKQANERIKDWVTSPVIAIRKMKTDTFMVRNSTHWIQCSNPHTHCPIFPGDSRITVMHVRDLENEIPKPQLIKQLIEQAPAFLHYLLNVEIPDSPSRLRIPILSSQIKQAIQETNKSPIEEFLGRFCKYTPGYVVPFIDVYRKFISTLDSPEMGFKFSKNAFSKQLPLGQYVNGRYGMGGVQHIGNITVEGLEAKKISDKQLILAENGNIR